MSAATNRCTRPGRRDRFEEGKGDTTTNSITTRDGAQVRYDERGTGRPVLFSHDWPLNADVWEPQVDFLASYGYRAVAHERLGHGRPDLPSGGSDMDAHADDLAELLEALNLEDIVLVGHGAGGGEVARYIGRHGFSRVAKLVLVGSVTPLLVQTEANPDGTPMEVFNGMRAGLTANPPRFFGELAEMFYGANRPGANVPCGVLDAFRSRALAGNLEEQLGGIGVFSETDFTEDLKKIDVPTLIVHGDDDQIVPIVPTALQTSKLVKGSILKVYEGAPHGLPVTHADRLNADLLEFI